MKTFNLICQISLFLACVTVSLCYRVTSAHAQSATLSISPPVVELIIAPNKKVTQTFHITTGDTSLTLTPEIYLVKPSDSSGHMTISPNPLDLSTIPLSVVGNPPLGIPLEATDLNYTLTVEAASTDVAEDVYLALVFHTSGNQADAQLTTTGGISALFLTSINPSGIMNINLDVTNFDLPSFRDSWLALDLQPVLENRGDTMIRPHGQISIQNNSGKVVYRRDLYPHLILGNASRNIQTVANIETCIGDTLDPKKCLPESLSWIPKWSDLGPHKITLTITTQGGTTITEIEKVIWFFPIRVTLVLIIILSLILYLYINRKHT